MTAMLCVSRCTARAIPRQSVRCLSASALARKDLVQDLYLRELKAFKPAAKAQNAHVGQVHEYKAPTAPSTPQSLSSADLAKELQEYEASSPADSTATTSSSGVETEGAEQQHGETADAFLERLQHEASRHNTAAVH